MLEFAISAGRSFGRFTQLILARNDVLPQAQFPALRIFVRRPRKEKSRSAVYALIRSKETIKTLKRRAKLKKRNCRQVFFI